MKTHLSFGGYLVRWRWRNDAPSDAVFECVGKLVSPTGHYADAPVVSVYHSPSKGWGYA